MYGVVVNSFFSGPFTSSSRVERSDPNIFYPESALILSGVPPMEISIRTVLSSIRIWILRVHRRLLPGLSPTFGSLYK